MLKKVVFTFLCLCLNLQVIASDKIIRFEDFVHFNDSQKIETIKIVHDYLIQVENTIPPYRGKLKSNKKYQTYKKIMRFFIQEAHAADSPINFNIPEGVKDKMCFYAGWMSFSYDGTCFHPETITDANLDMVTNTSNVEFGEGEKEFFLKLNQRYKENNQFENVNTISFNGTKFELTTNAKSSCERTKDIICNPKIFGTYEGKPFCVPGNRNFGINSSLMCAKGAEAVKEIDEEKYDAMMLKIGTDAILEGQGSGNEFLYTLRAMYDTCLCAGGNDSKFSGSIDFKYAQSIYFERTCFGIINQTENIYKSFYKNSAQVCKQLLIPNKINGTTGIDWDHFLNKAHGVIKDQNYSSLISQHLNTFNEDNIDIASEADARARKEADTARFRERRQQHYQQYLDQGLCPIGSLENPAPVIATSTPKPKIEIEAVPYEDDPEKYMVTLKLFAAPVGEAAAEPIVDSETIGTLELIFAQDEAPQGVELTPQNESPAGSKIYIVSRIAELYQVRGKATVGEEILSDKKDIPALEKKEYISISKTENGTEHFDVIVKVLAPGANEGDDPTIVTNAENIKLVGLAPGENAEITPDEEHSVEGEKKFKVKRLAELYQVEASADLGGTPLEKKKEDIPKIEAGPELAIKVEDYPEDKSYSIVTLSAKKAPVGEEDAEAETGATSFSLKKAEGVDHSPNISDQGDATEGVKKYKVKKHTEAFNVFGSANFPDIEEAIVSDNATIPALEVATGDKCSFELALVEGEEGYTIDAKISYNGVEYPNDERKYPEGSSLTWYDSAVSAGSSNSSNSRSSAGLDSVDSSGIGEEEERQRSDEDLTEDAEEVEQAIDDIKSRLGVSPVTGEPTQLTGVPPLPQKRFMAAVFSVEGAAGKCRGADVVEIPGTGQQNPAARNDNPVQIQGPPRMNRGRGKIINGLDTSLRGF